MKTRLPLTLSLAATVFALPGCIIVTSDKHYRHATNAELETVRCVNPGEDVPSVRTTYRQELEKLHPGMSPDEFRAVLPAAVFVEERKDEGGRTLHAYSLKCN